MSVKVKRQRRLRATGVLAISMLASAPAICGTFSALPSGSAITYGGISSPHNLQTTMTNPAAASAFRRFGYSYSHGLLGVSVAAELGSVDDFLDELDDLEEALEADDLTAQEAQELKARFDDFLERAGRDGYVKIGVSAQPPFSPFVISVPALAGTFSISADAHALLKVEVIDDEIRIVDQGNGKAELESDTSLLLTGGYATRLSFGFGGPAHIGNGGTLFVGGTLNLWNAELGRALAAVDDDRDDDDDDDAFDNLQDDFEDNSRSGSLASVDAGVLWQARQYQVGGYVRNLNAPSLRYPDLGEACTVQRSCDLANAFGDRIPGGGNFALERQFTAEVGVHTTDRQWFVGASLDLNDARDVAGDKQQWLSVAGGYKSSGRHWYLPGWRLGYRSNQSGSELTYYTAGLTFGRVLNIDVAQATDTVEDDGDKVPRGAMVAISLEMPF